jgi:cyclopropane-fatty-acyl-phospholipid synthase
MDGDFSTPDLTALIAFGLTNQDALAAQLKGSLLVRLVAGIRHRINANTRTGSRRNIAYHYDLGNAFYGLWLDETMTYSSAVFADDGETLADAQRAKYRRIIAGLGLKPGDRVLEIGCGWGGFAETAAREAGASVTCLTISRQQAEFARARMAAAGLSDKVEIREQDYRDVTGTFDKIVSIEMFEAVGEENWPVYFKAVHDRLVDGGRAMLQVITIANERFAAYRKSIDFIQRYIFPGGMLPSPDAFAQSATAAGLELGGVAWFGQSYAETLKRWSVRFEAVWPQIAPLGFDERFHRMWRYYLNSCEACFSLGATDVGQFLIHKR